MARTVTALLALLLVSQLLPGAAAAAAPARRDGGAGQSRAAAARGPSIRIVFPADAAAQEVLAAREVQRYLYLRTGRLLPLARAKAAPQAPDVILVARKQSALARAAARRASLAGKLEALEDQSYLLRTVPWGRGRLLLVCGGSPTSTLYAAYRLAEHLGVRFYLHGDVVPDGRIPLKLPDLSEVRRPLFALRGILPFHDFCDGPDWWNADDYKAVLSQLPKLGMNFLGLHTYPEPIAEPTVWIGPVGDVGVDGRVRTGYPTAYHTTLRATFGYRSKKTSDYLFGTSQLFDRDDFGGEVMRGMAPAPASAEDCVALFNRTGALLRDAFEYARSLGVKTCVGTETPLTVPRAVQDRLRASGKDPGDPAVVQSLYEGIFTRIARAYPVDYYWLWTPEGWTWSGSTEEQTRATLKDLQVAQAAAAGVSAPFRLATCGWVLGPSQDRALFDRELPRGWVMSCINRQVGQEPVDPAFAQVRRHEKWAIPWLEDDPALTSPQLWAGRMRRDAVDALRYGCDGLLGIHWRTRALGPNVSALAMAAWEQGSWARRRGPEEGVVGGQVVDFPNNPIAGTDQPALYRSVRYGLSAYRFTVPKGRYRVTLRFCEPHYDAAGKRVFGVKLQRKPVIESLDIFARVGKNRALDYVFEDVEAPEGRLEVGFVSQVEFPCIAGLDIEGPGYEKRVNCGGPSLGRYAADLVPEPRDLPCDDFYRDWALHQFGPEAGPAVARIFARMDGRVPRPSEWVEGPGGLRPDPRPWSQVSQEYRFVDELAALEPKVKGAGNRARFRYWLDTFRYNRSLARLRCDWGRLNQALAAAEAEKDAARRARLARERALSLRREVIRRASETFTYLLGTVSTLGELGTVSNLQQQGLPAVLETTARKLEELLGEPLPGEAAPTTAYTGPTRLIVPTVRTVLQEGEALALKAIVMGRKPPREVALYWRPLGGERVTRRVLKHAARGVYTAALPASALGGRGLEYHVKVVDAEGRALHFPATAPERGQTVVVMPASGRSS